ncbi:hypothetical protein [Psychromarinibacter sp. S121]|uniref:hypothetical protein n=1 Tax=Psychromarinibacter sp. S121 TaxID=3415127 RepID=UPI003C7D2854
MARLVLAVLFVGILVLAGLVVVRTVRGSFAAMDQGRGLDMAENGMLPKIAYVLLIALILYVVLWGS